MAFDNGLADSHALSDPFRVSWMPRTGRTVRDRFKNVSSGMGGHILASAPGYKFWLPLPVGVLGEAIRTPLEFQRRAQKQFGDVVRLQLGPFVTHFLYHPEHVSRVLRDQQKNYLRGYRRYG